MRRRSARSAWLMRFHGAPGQDRCWRRGCARPGRNRRKARKHATICACHQCCATSTEKRVRRLLPDKCDRSLFTPRRVAKGKTWAATAHASTVTSGERSPAASASVAAYVSAASWVLNNAPGMTRREKATTQVAPLARATTRAAFFLRFHAVVLVFMKVVLSRSGSRHSQLKPGPTPRQ